MIVTLTLNAAVDRILSVPGLRQGGVLRAELKALIPAGKGFNVSRVLAELGTSSIAVGIVGAGEVDLYAASFMELGVEPLLYEHPEATRSNITVIDPKSGFETHLRERGPKVPVRTLDRMESEMFPAAPEDGPLKGPPADFFAFCGSLPLGATPKRLARMLTSARKSGRRLFVDTSGAALRSSWGLRPEVISVNAEELAELTGANIGAPAEVVSAARELLAASGRVAGRSSVILVKLGADGAVAVTPSETWRARPPAVAVRNTVGAGDAFNAGYLAREAAGLSEALGFAVACGSAQAASRGLGWLRNSQAERLAAQIRPEAL